MLDFVYQNLHAPWLNAGTKSKAEELESKNKHDSAETISFKIKSTPAMSSILLYNKSITWE